MTEVIVQPPDNTPEGDRLFLAGDTAALGHWSPDGLALERRPDGRYGAQIVLPPDTQLRYLVTRGTWRTAEAAAPGEERQPRPLTAEAPTEITVTAWGRESIRYHPDFPSAILSNRRTLTVYLPPGYGREPGRRYSVFYLHDGQNLFDATTAFGGVPWAADETAERLIRSELIAPVILVGVANTDQRLEEYGPAAHHGRVPGRDFPFARFLVEEVKPFIDGTYLTNPGRRHTAVGGSSMGGLIALFLCHWYPEVFGRCAALSPSLWWDRDLILRVLHELPCGLRRTRLWIDTGTREGPTPRGRREQVRRARQLAALLAAAGLHEGRDFRYLEVAGGEHNEAAWAARFGDVLRFLFGTPRGRASEVESRPS
jgi:predicted alpha/beta superfamily hydrolase